MPCRGKAKAELASHLLDLLNDGGRFMHGQVTLPKQCSQLGKKRIVSVIHIGTDLKKWNDGTAYGTNSRKLGNKRNDG